MFLNTVLLFLAKTPITQELLLGPHIFDAACFPLHISVWLLQSSEEGRLLQISPVKEARVVGAQERGLLDGGL